MLDEKIDTTDWKHSYLSDKYVATASSWLP